MDFCFRFDAARAGEPSALAALVDHVAPRLKRMAAYYARCTGEPRDDLLQEAWQGLLEGLACLDPAIGSPIQYLILRARWRLLSFVRAARLRRCLPLRDVILCNDSLLSAADNAMDLADFHASLHSPQRDVLSCLWSGLTWRQTGQVLGCTSANVAYHVRQIRRQYQQRMADEDRRLARPARETI